MKSVPEFVCYLFGDDPDIIIIITSFTSSNHFEVNTRSFSSPLIRESGGVFGFYKQPYRIENKLEKSLFEILQRMHKIDFYNTIVEYLRQYHDNILYFVKIFERMSKINISNDQLEKFIDSMINDFDQMAKKFLILYLANLDETTVSRWFKHTELIFNDFKIEIMRMLKNIKESVNNCCAVGEQESTVGHAENRLPKSNKTKKRSVSAEMNETEPNCSSTSVSPAAKYKRTRNE